MNRSRTFQDAAALEAATDSRASDVLIVVCASFLLALSFLNGANRLAGRRLESVLTY